MAPTRRALYELQMASPCAAEWDGQMDGTERIRRCQRCQLNVYRIADLTREEAEDVVRQGEGHQCRSLYRRQDGTVLPRDCPVGVAKARKAARWWKERVFHLFLLALPIFIIDTFIFIDPDSQQTAFDPGRSVRETFDDLGDLFSPAPAAPAGSKAILYYAPKPLVLGLQDDQEIDPSDVSEPSK